MSSALAVAVKGLKKSYGDFEAVKGIDFEISQGEIFSLLGPNGAGKTTTVEILEGFRKKSSGELEVLGLNPERDRTKLKEHIGIVPQTGALDRYLTVMETVTMYAGYYRNPQSAEHVIELVGLQEKKNERALRLSGGQQRRLEVAIALVGNPDLLFLDEPTTGFDPAARRETWQVIKGLAELGKTILLTTHYMDEAEFLADHIAVIARGEIVAAGTPYNLGGRDKLLPRISLLYPNGVNPPAELKSVITPSGTTAFDVEDITSAIYIITEHARAHNVSLNTLQIVRPSLEDVYLSLIGNDEGQASGNEAPAPRGRRPGRR
ncbi:MAG: ABC transporter ATP-binding protein [Firmicutes bacterium]|jgi:ABC-2 type transport system ATP-binding protein|nr:ABC transporter ATP-binding protein [Bacillota bacterium]